MNYKKIIVSSLLISGITLISVPVFAETVASYTSNGVVNFTASTDSTNPVDPLDPTNPVKPVDPTNPDGPNPGTSGPLSIDYASSFKFGEQKITSTTQTYYAETQKYSDLNEDGTINNEVKEGPNYVQVTDNRGTESGWSLTVTQDNQFINENNKELTGSQITLSNGTLQTNSESMPPDVTENIDLIPGKASIVMNASSGKGAGTYLTDFGKDKETAAQSVSLQVPGTTTKYATTYNTTFTWTLANVPN